MDENQIKDDKSGKIKILFYKCPRCDNTTLFPQYTIKPGSQYLLRMINQRGVDDDVFFEFECAGCKSKFIIGLTANFTTQNDN
jgi:ribosomal protein S27E